MKLSRKIIPWLAFIAVLLLLLASTGLDAGPAYQYRQYHKADGEPMNVAQVMRSARLEDVK